LKFNRFSIGSRLATTFGLVVLITASLAIVATLLVESIKQDIQHEADVLDRRELLATEWIADIRKECNARWPRPASASTRHRASSPP
jgi:hypothetical protein